MGWPGFSELGWDSCSWHDSSMFVTVPPWYTFSCADAPHPEKGGVWHSFLL